MEIRKIKSEIEDTAKRWSKGYPTLGDMSGKIESWAKTLYTMKSYKNQTHPAVFRAYNILAKAYQNDRADRNAMTKAVEDVLVELKQVDESFVEPAKMKSGYRAKMYDNTELAGHYAFLGYDNPDTRNLDGILQQIQSYAYRNADEIQVSHIKSLAEQVSDIQRGYTNVPSVYADLDELVRTIESAAYTAKVKSDRNVMMSQNSLKKAEKMIERIKAKIYRNDKPRSFKSAIDDNGIKQIIRINRSLDSVRHAIKFNDITTTLGHTRQAFTKVHSVLSRYDETIYNRMLNNAIKSLSSSVAIHNNTRNRAELMQNKDFVTNYEQALYWYDNLIAEVTKKQGG